MSDWTEDDKAMALELYHEYGATVAAKYADTSRQTIHSWVRQAKRDEEASRQPEQLSWPADKIQATKPKHQGKSGRWFIVDVDGVTRRLHWFDNERVELADAALAREDTRKDSE